METSRKTLAKVVIKQLNETVTYMVFFDDLFRGYKDLQNLIHDTEQKKPHKCSKCESEEIADLEVLGTGKDPLFWVCLECDTLYMMLTIEKTLDRLHKVSDTWTNPNDWGWKEKDEFN